MVDLKCEREDCKFNKSCNCTANGIDVANNTICATYEKSEKPKHEQDKIPQALVRHNTNVRCAADCLFEDECHCIANGITVENLKLNPDTCDCGCQSNGNFTRTGATNYAGGTANAKTNGNITAGTPTNAHKSGQQISASSLANLPKANAKIWPTCTCADKSKCQPCCSSYLPK